MNAVKNNPLKDPFGMLMGTLDMMAGGMEHRNDVFNTVVGGIKVDTVCPGDTGEWETGVCRKGGKWVIVEQYLTREHAEKGHAAWVAVAADPRQTFRDVFEADAGWGVADEREGD